MRNQELSMGTTGSRASTCGPGVGVNFNRPEMVDKFRWGESTAAKSAQVRCVSKGDDYNHKGGEWCHLILPTKYLK